MVTRRELLEASFAATLAARLYAAPADARKPNRELEKLGDAALASAKRLKATYCDIRIVRYREQTIRLRMTPERGTGKTLAVPFVSDTGSFGFGARVIADGAWGFAASPIVTGDEIARVCGEAVAVARANAVLKGRPVHLAPVRAYRDRWQTPHERNPFSVPLEEKLGAAANRSWGSKGGQGCLLVRFEACVPVRRQVLRLL